MKLVRVDGSQDFQPQIDKSRYQQHKLDEKKLKQRQSEAAQVSSIFGMMQSPGVERADSVGDFFK